MQSAYKFGMWLCDIPTPYTDENDDKATGIRNKPARYLETMYKWLGMWAGAIGWGGEPFDSLPPFLAELWLQSSGFSAVVERGGNLHYVSGINSSFRGAFTEYFQPVGLIVSNPYAPEINGEYTFGKNAVLIKNDPQMQGVLPILMTRAEMLTENDVSFLCGLQNLRIINIIRAANDKIEAAAKSFFRQIRWGRSGIITGSQKSWSGDNSNMIENLPTGGVPANYMLQFIETAQYIKGTLYNEMGLQSNFNMKRESLNDSEISANNDTLRPYIDNMLECRKNAVKEIKRVFGVDVTVNLIGAWKTREEIAEATAEKATEPEEPTGEPGPDTETEAEQNENPE